MNILSIDHGDKRIGFAIGNSIRKISTPLNQITNSSLDFVISQIKSLIIQYEIEQIIIGIPFNEDGGDSLQSLKVRDFANIIKTELNLVVLGVDERFSSIDSEKLLIDIDVSRKKRKKSLDSLSASIILKRYFDNEECVRLWIIHN